MANIRLMAFGGLDEDGKDMFLLEIDNDIFIVDCGLKYPNSSEMLGVEFIIPDFTYISENKDRVKAIFITHGHDDVMGGLPYLLDVCDAPVYATALTKRILSRELIKHGNRKTKINIIARAGNVTIAGHTIHTFPVMQSIADSIGLSFETSEGQIIFSNEFIVDYDFMNEAFMMNINSLSQMGSHNVLALISESKGANRPGYTSPRHRISNHIARYFEMDYKRVFITLYKQNLFRIIEILELAIKYQYKVYFCDEANLNLLRDVEELGYYKIPRNLIIDSSDFNNEMENIIIVVAGSGKETFTLMNRIALGDNQKIGIKENDVVIIASPIVPGTEKSAAHMEDDLYKAGVDVFKVSAKEVLAMHASVEDLKMMLNLMRPKYYIPCKGEYADLMANAEIATKMGYRPDRIVILDNGQIAEFKDGNLISTHDLIELNDCLISGSDKLDVTGMVIKDREVLSTDGAIVLGVVLDFNTKKVIGGPDVQSRGVIYLKDADYILNEVSNILIQTIDEMVAEGTYENLKARAEAKDKILKYIQRQTGKRPMILPAIVEINLGASSAEK